MLFDVWRERDHIRSLDIYIYISQNQKNVTIRLKLKKPLIQHFFNDLHTIISQYLKTFYERSLLSGRSGKIGPTIVVMFTFRSEWVMINN